jgi:hypothetical protein
MKLVGLATLLVLASGCTGKVMCAGGPAYPIDRDECSAKETRQQDPYTAARDPRIRSRVTGIDSGLESVPYRRVRMTFSNASGLPCQITAYTLVWPSGKKTIELSQALKLAPQAEEERTLRIDATDGNLESLSESSTSMQVSFTCP